MKKQNLTKLSLKKKTISNFPSNRITGGNQVRVFTLFDNTCIVTLCAGDLH